MPKSRRLHAASQANSLILTRRNRVLLDYFPTSAIFCIHSTTTRAWSPFQYIYEATSASSSMVMHMILAYSASEMRQMWRNDVGGSSSSSSSTAVMEQTELHHYAAALRELQSCIGVQGDRSGSGSGTEAEVEAEIAWHWFEKNFDAMLTTIFFMIHYGLQSMSSLEHAKTHMAGLGSLVATYVRSRKSRNNKGRRWSGGEDGTQIDVGPTPQPSSPDEHDHDHQSFSPLSSLLLLWILYADIIGHSYGASQDLVSVFGDELRPLLSLSQLFRGARLNFSSLWGDRFSYDYRSGNSEKTLRSLEMAHHVQLIRSRIWKARAVTRTRTGDREAQARRYSSLMEELLLLQKTYSDVFQQAPSSIDTNKNATTTTAENFATRHVAEITTKLIAHYWACVLFCRRWLSSGTVTEPDPDPVHLLSLSRIIEYLPDADPSPNPNPNRALDTDTRTDTHVRNQGQWQGQGQGKWDWERKKKGQKDMLIRYAWPTFMAAIETSDVGQRDSLLGRLRAVRDASAECQWCWDTAREITILQQQEYR